MIGLAEEISLNLLPKPSKRAALRAQDEAVVGVYVRRLPGTMRLEGGTTSPARGREQLEAFLELTASWMCLWEGAIKAPLLRS